MVAVSATCRPCPVRMKPGPMWPHASARCKTGLAMDAFARIGKLHDFPRQRPARGGGLRGIRHSTGCDLLLGMTTVQVSATRPPSYMATQSIDLVLQIHPCSHRAEVEVTGETLLKDGGVSPSANPVWRVDAQVLRHRPMSIDRADDLPLTAKAPPVAPHTFAERATAHRLTFAPPLRRRSQSKTLGRRPKMHRRMLSSPVA